MKVFIQSIVGQLLLTPYIAYRGQQALPSVTSRIIFLFICIAELSLFLIGFIFRNELPDDQIINIQLICNTWYFSSIYATMALALVEVLKLSNRYKPWFPSVILKNYRKVKLSLFVFITVGVITLMLTAYNNVNKPIVKNVYIEIPKNGGILDSLTIAMMSDLHIGEVINRRYVEKYVAMCNAEKPDLILLVGDIVDYEVRHAEREKIEEVLQQLKAPLGVYAVNGNHEYRANRYAKQRWFKEAGIIMLKDSVVSLANNSIYLIGRDDLVNKNRTALQALMHNLDPLKPTIILDHQPESFVETAMNKGDLALHGHTHGGQIWPYTILINQAFECVYGSYKKGDSQYFVSSGIGTAGPPYRIGTRSELVMLHIKFVSE